MERPGACGASGVATGGFFVPLIKPDDDEGEEIPTMTRRFAQMLAAVCLACLGACADSGDVAPPTGPANNDPSPDPAPNNDPTPDPQPQPDPSPEPQPDPGEDCAQIPGCEPGDPADYDYDVPASFVARVIIEQDPELGEDVDGDGAVDNALGAFLGDLSRLLAVLDINQQYADTIADGRMVFGATWPTLIRGEAVEDGQEVIADFLPLSDVDGDPAQTGRFRAQERGFIQGSLTPRMRFVGSVSGGVFTAGPGAFSMPFPIGEVVLELSLEQARLSGAISSDERGIEIDDMGLTGGFSVSGLVDVLNDYLLSGECPCLGLEAPLLSLDGCLGEADGSSCEGEQAICASVAASCGLLGQILTSNADLDLDSDGQNDALSVFLRMDAVGTRVEGVQRD